LTDSTPYDLKLVPTTLQSTLPLPTAVLFGHHVQPLLQTQKELDRPVLASLLALYSAVHSF